MGGVTLGLFQGIGIEAEYMIVDRETLSVRPVSDLLLRGANGVVENEVGDGPLCRSNELVKHLIELKTDGPVPSLEGADALFAGGVRRANEELSRHGCMLLPTAMHPLMDPRAETRLWDHDYTEIYRAYDRIFDCKNHGWANLQSLHLNLPFADDREFAALHAAVRVALPLIPALAASSPFKEGRLTGFRDTRLEVYRFNQRLVPSIGGEVIPEPVFTRRDYEREILGPIYRDIAPHDPDGLLGEEWLNSRGAIARFERNTIEIRLIDTQECPAMDGAVATAVVCLVRGLVEGLFAPAAELRSAGQGTLTSLLLDTVRLGGDALIEGRDYQGLLGLDGTPRSASEVWRLLIQLLAGAYPGMRKSLKELELILDRGCLADRIVRGCGGGTREEIIAAYRELARCLARNEPYLP